MSAAANLRRTDRDAEIVVYENLHIYLLVLWTTLCWGNFDNVDRMLVRTQKKLEKQE